MNEELTSAEIHSSREVIYSLLSHIYLYAPSDKMYKMLNDIFNLIEDIDEKDNAELYKIKEFITKRNSIKDKTELAEFDLDTLRHYTRVFCLTDSVPMSESYYTSREKLVMQESHDKVMAIYNQLGFAMKDLNSNEPYDHISLELSFMSYTAMCSKNNILQNNVSRLNTLVEAQRYFLDNHLLAFIEKFAERVSTYPEAQEFYLPITKFMLGYIQEDKLLLQEI